MTAVFLFTKSGHFTYK